MEQEQKLKEHHTVEAPGGQKVSISKKNTAPSQDSACVHIVMVLGNVNSCVHYIICW